MAVRPLLVGAVSPCGSSGRRRSRLTLCSLCSVLSPFDSFGGVGCGTARGVRVLRSRVQVLCRGDWRRVVTLCPVLKHGPRSARDAQVGRVVSGPRSCLRDPCVWNGRSESNFVGARALGRPEAHRWPSRMVTLWPVSSASVSVATRKMVNYA